MTRCLPLVVLCVSVLSVLDVAVSPAVDRDLMFSFIVTQAAVAASALVSVAVPLGLR